MRNKLVLGLVLLMSLAWAAAQQQSTSPSTPAPDTGQQTQNTPATPATPAAPAAPSAQAAPSAGEPDVIEGCLGGSAPNFTVTDTAGTTYRLDIPPGADAAVLTKHLGESVQVMGDVSKGGSAAATEGASSSKGAGASIAVQKIGRGKGTCPASPDKGAGTTKPPSN
jgi:hypothetical protein